ncbi:hypothetical protein ACFV2H_26590, partial [Streptomyces sp. NPDC059629]
GLVLLLPYPLGGRRHRPAPPAGGPARGPGQVVPSAPVAQASGDVRTTSKPSPGAPGTVNTSRPDPADTLGVLGQ